MGGGWNEGAKKTAKQARRGGGRHKRTVKTVSHVGGFLFRALNMSLTSDLPGENRCKCQKLSRTKSPFVGFSDPENG